MNIEIHNNIQVYPLKKFNVETLVVDSEYLKQNPLNDSPIKYNLVLKPKNFDSSRKYKAMIILSGFTGNASKSFSHKPFQKNFPQILDTWCDEHKVSDTVFLFVDAMTFFGGSQFLDSPMLGQYESYIVKELFSEFVNSYSISEQAKDICITGGSSGGYGALHLGSKHPNLFGNIAAIAPDCDFNLSLLPELYHVLPLIEKWGGVSAIKQEIRDEKFFNRRDSHAVINVIAMAYCYSSQVNDLNFPFDVSSGELDKELWDSWLKHDPLNFLQHRKNNIETLSSIYLDVGIYDQFNLQYGARKLNKLLSSYDVNFKYSEFKGNHFDISKRRDQVWNWFLK